jgi:hypothetical protein
MLLTRFGNTVYVYMIRKRTISVLTKGRETLSIFPVDVTRIRWSFFIDVITGFQCESKGERSVGTKTLDRTLARSARFT